MDANTQELSDEQIAKNLDTELNSESSHNPIISYYSYRDVIRQKRQEEQDNEFAKKLQEEMDNQSLKALKEQERLDEKLAKKLQKNLDRTSENTESSEEIQSIPCNASNVKARIEALIEYYKENNLGNFEHILTKKGYTDPINLEFMDDPIILSDSQTYQKQTAQQLLSINGMKSPLVPNQVLDKNTFVPNYDLRKEMYAFVQDTEKECKLSLKRKYNNAFPEIPETNEQQSKKIKKS